MRGRVRSSRRPGGGCPGADREHRCLGGTDRWRCFTRAAREFHDLLFAFTANGTVRHVIDSLVALWSVQEQTWAEAMTQRGEYPSLQEASRAVDTHRRIAAEIAAGHAAEAERIARAHLATTQKVVLERFEDGIVTVSSARAWHAIAAGRPTRT